VITTLQSKPLLGTGIYTVPDIAMILGIRYSKVNRWINAFWNDRFGARYGETYTWKVDLTRAVNFLTLIELNTFYRLSEVGVSTREILNVHEILSNQFDTPYPFARRNVLDALRSEGKKVMFEQADGSIYTIDATRQFNLALIKDFFKNLDFGSDHLVSRIWPMGKKNSIVCDPHHQFGQPVINGTNIVAQVLYEMHLAGEPSWFIADLYTIKEKNVTDAIQFCKHAA
jgi:uncharacterized protein (DUF433 family)